MWHVGRLSATPSPGKVRNDVAFFLFACCILVFSKLMTCISLTLFQDLSMPGGWAQTCSLVQVRRRMSGARWRWLESSWKTAQYWWRPAGGSTRPCWSKMSRRADFSLRLWRSGTFYSLRFPPCLWWWRLVVGLNVWAAVYPKNGQKYLSTDCFFKKKSYFWHFLGAVISMTES